MDWQDLDEPTLAALDSAVVERGIMGGILLLRERLGLSLVDAQSLAHMRRSWLREHHPERFPREPSPEERIEARLPAMPGEPLAVEAFWDGDSEGWFVVLCVMVRLPDGRIAEHVLTNCRRGGDFRLFTGEVPPWPEAQWTRETGEALAAKLGVSFWFGSPEMPDDDAPRWQPA